MAAPCVAGAAGSTRMLIPDLIPQNLRAAAISLADLGIDDAAWRAGDALEVVASLRGTSVVIAGGDLYQIESWGIAPMAEGWRCARFGSELATDYADRSRKVAAAFIQDSRLRLGDRVLYLLMFSLQQDAA